MAETKSYKILSINPGSTSTKIGCFEGEKVLFSANVSHDATKLAEFKTVSDQMPYRIETILKCLKEASIDLSTIDAFVGRGGGLFATEGGTYEINDIILDHAYRGANGVQHPAQLGSQIAYAFGKQFNKPSYVVNPPDTDEYCLEARITGIKGIYRTSHLHALNLKETAIRHAKHINKRYEDCNLVVCHIGGGISISAHQHGKMIDGNDIVGGEGPMAPTRCGGIPVAETIKFLEKHETKELKELCTRTGGFVSHLGTSDAKEVTKMVNDGDKTAQIIWNSMLYQIVKYIGAMAAALKGEVDGILLGGGMVHDESLVKYIKDNCSWIAPVTAYPGEFELEAMAAGAIRVLSGNEKPKIYTGKPCWSPEELK